MREFFPQATPTQMLVVPGRTMPHQSKKLISFLCLVHLVPMITGECVSPPLVIDSLVSFECSVLSDDLNIHSLTQAFFPVNRRQALVVEVHYYVNRTLHPLELSATETRPADYTYVWFASPVLGFIEPRMLSGLSLNTLTLTHNLNFAHLLIAPLASDDEDWIRGMLTNGTAWLKSYTEVRLSGGIQSVSRGFSAYKPNPMSDDYFLYSSAGSGVVVEAHVPLLGASLMFAVIIVGILIPNAIHKHFHILHKWSLPEKTPEQSFKFRNLFWAGVMVLLLGNIGMHGYIGYHFLTFGLRWRTSYGFIYPMFTAAILVVHILSVATAVKIGRRFYLKNILVTLPRGLYVFFLRCCSCSRIKTSGGKVQKVIIAVWQGLAIWGAMTAGIFSCIFLIGIVMALFVDPVQVVVTLAIYTNITLCALIAFASVFETTDKISGKGKTPRGRCAAYLKFVFESLLFVITLLFIVMFGYTYATIVFFAGGSYSELFSSLGELFPVFLFSAITWLLRKEINKYKTKPAETEDGEPQEQEMDVYRVNAETELDDAEPNSTDVYKVKNEKPGTEFGIDSAEEMNGSGRTENVSETSEPKDVCN